MKTRCLIVDDEPLARELIRGHILKLENFEVVDECDNAMKAMEDLRDGSEVKIDNFELDIPEANVDIKGNIDFLN